MPITSDASNVQNHLYDKSTSINAALKGQSVASQQALDNTLCELDGTDNKSRLGANALIDNLIKMGIVKEQDAMGARMMMGMMAVPGDGPDTLKSKIEINE